MGQDTSAGRPAARVPADDGVGHAVRMPLDPITVDTFVPVTPTQAFVGFTAQMGEWWDPMLTPDPPTFSSIEIDPEGDVATVHTDGERYVWGRVTTWEPLGHFGQRSGSATTRRSRPSWT